MITSGSSQSTKSFFTCRLSTLSYVIQISTMQLAKFIVACMPLAVLASPIEQHGADLVGREADPEAWVEVPGFSERSDEPNELFRRKCYQYYQGDTEHFSSRVHVSDTLIPAR